MLRINDKLAAHPLPQAADVDADAADADATDACGSVEVMPVHLKL